MISIFIFLSFPSPTLLRQASIADAIFIFQTEPPSKAVTLWPFIYHDYVGKAAGIEADERIALVYSGVFLSKTM
jgi:hypothetical protein